MREEGYFSILQDPEMGWKGYGAVATPTVDPKKKTRFLVKTYIEDFRQDEKHVLDLLESIMRPTDPVKDELRQKLFKMIQFWSKIKKMRISKFWIPEIQSFPAGGQHNLLAQ